MCRFLLVQFMPAISTQTFTLTKAQLSTRMIQHSWYQWHATLGTQLSQYIYILNVMYNKQPCVLMYTFQQKLKIRISSILVSSTILTASAIHHTMTLFRFRYKSYTVITLHTIIVPSCYTVSEILASICLIKEANNSKLKSAYANYYAHEQ